MIILVLLTLIRFHEQIVHYKLLRFVNVLIIDLYVDVENTAHCVHLSLSAVHQSHAYVFDSALSLYCIEMATSFKSLYVKNVITVWSFTVLLDHSSFYEYHHSVLW
jgi:KaiC/GvpD/RAD55 family RecA-like ATPase